MNSLFEKGLAGCRVVITRPLEQAHSLKQAIQQQGGEAILFPLLEIVELENTSAFDAVARTLKEDDWAIFISTNAVHFGLRRLQQLQVAVPPMQSMAMGPATAAALAEYGIAKPLMPTTRFDSEGLLDLPEMQDVAGKRIIIFRGVGGRDVLATTLQRRGAKVEFAECYRRINPNRDMQRFFQLWQNGELQALVLTSSEALRNLLELVEGHESRLKEIVLFVNHARIAESALEHGLNVRLASAPGDESMITALKEWWIGKSS